jgi:hypothetical protein
VSYVSRRRLDADDFDPDAVDEEGLPLVYNEARIAAFWGKRPGELASRWTRFAAISGERLEVIVLGSRGSGMWCLGYSQQVDALRSNQR